MPAFSLQAGPRILPAPFPLERLTHYFAGCPATPAASRNRANVLKHGEKPPQTINYSCYPQT